MFCRGIIYAYIVEKRYALLGFLGNFKSRDVVDDVVHTVLKVGESVFGGNSGVFGLKKEQGRLQCLVVKHRLSLESLVELPGVSAVGQGFKNVRKVDCTIHLDLVAGGGILGRKLGVQEGNYAVPGNDMAFSGLGYTTLFESFVTPRYVSNISLN